MFKKNFKLVLELNSVLYELPIYEDVNLSQVLKEEELERKTLHNKHYVKDALIKKANPGNLKFTIPILGNSEFDAILKSFLNTNPLTFYCSLGNKYKKIIKFVTESVVINIEKDSILTISVSGSFSKYENVSSIGTTQELSRDFSYIEGLGIDIDNKKVNYLTSVNLEFQNRIQWLENNTISSGSIVYPKDYILTEKLINGTIEANQEVFETEPSYSLSSDMSLIIKMEGQEVINVYLPSIVFTKRFELDEVLKEGYDFRLNTNKQIELNGESI